LKLADPLRPQADHDCSDAWAHRATARRRTLWFGVSGSIDAIAPLCSTYRQASGTAEQQCLGDTVRICDDERRRDAAADPGSSRACNEFGTSSSMRRHDQARIRMLAQRAIEIAVTGEIRIRWREIAPARTPEQGR